jgi:hypothetical protein
MDADLQEGRDLAAVRTVHAMEIAQGGIAQMGDRRMNVNPVARLRTLSAIIES